jgi:hypothetical protein
MGATDELHHAQLTEYVSNSSAATRDYMQTMQAGAAINRSIDVEARTCLLVLLGTLINL